MENKILKLNKNECLYLEGILERECASLNRDIEFLTIKEALESSEQIDIDFITEILNKLYSLKRKNKNEK